MEVGITLPILSQIFITLNIRKLLDWG